MNNRAGLVYIVTHPMTARLLLQGQLRFMKQAGFNLTVLSAPGPDLSAVGEQESVSTIAVPLHREISPWKDFVALVRLTRVLRELRPAIVNASTPKAGLLGMMAARLARVPVRIYTLRGLRLQTRRGFSRQLLVWSERMAASCATRIFCVSESLKRAYLDLKLAPENKLAVLGKGSSNGLNPDRFPETPDQKQIEALRSSLQIAAGVPVIGFVGRFTRDKGIAELLQAFDGILAKHPDARLLLVGDFEAGDPVAEEHIRRIKQDNRIVVAGFVAETAPYFRLMTVLGFPSYREGFPNVPLEAAAACVPVVGFRVTGVMDAIEDGVTGKLVEPGNVEEFAKSMCDILENREMQREMGASGRARVLRDFKQTAIWETLLHAYDELLRRCGPGGTLS